MFEKMFVERLRTCFEALFGEEHSHFCEQWVKKSVSVAEHTFLLV